MKPTLPPRLRVALELSRSSSLTQTQLAKQLGISQSALAMRLKRAHQILGLQAPTRRRIPIYPMPLSELLNV